MSKEKKKQANRRDVTARTLDHEDILRELLFRDPRSGTLASLILQRYGYCSCEQNRSEEEIATEIETLRDALSHHYCIPLPTIPTAKELAEIREDVIGELERGGAWLDPRDEERLALIDEAFPELKAYLTEQLAAQPLPDTLDAHVLDTLVDNVTNTFWGVSLDENQDEQTVFWLRQTVRAAYHEAHAQTYMAFSAEEKKSLITHAVKAWVKNVVVNSGGYNVLRTERNWVAPGELILGESPDGTPVCWVSAGQAPPQGEPPTLTITVDLSKVHLVGITELAKEFASYVEKALTALPPEWQPYPEELHFLRIISQDDFQRDLQRFDLHQKYGLTYRHIAWLEERECTGRPIPSSPQPQTIGKPILGEDGVEKSVQRISRAIHRTPYRARRSRLDTPAQGLEVYYCSTHPLGDCPPDCPNLKEWMRQFDATAPTSTTGKGELSRSDDELMELEKERVRQEWSRRGYAEDNNGAYS